MPEGFDDILLIAVVFAAVFVASVWLSLVMWAYRDMRQRSRDPLAQALVALLVLLLNVPGIFVYILLRPRETLSEVYEAIFGRRSLAARDRREAWLPKLFAARTTRLASLSLLPRPAKKSLRRVRLPSGPGLEHLPAMRHQPGELHIGRYDCDGFPSCKAIGAPANRRQVGRVLDIAEFAAVPIQISPSCPTV